MLFLHFHADSYPLQLVSSMLFMHIAMLFDRFPPVSCNVLCCFQFCSSMFTHIAVRLVCFVVSVCSIVWHFQYIPIDSRTLCRRCCCGFTCQLVLAPCQTNVKRFQPIQLSAVKFREVVGVSACGRHGSESVYAFLTRSDAVPDISSTFASVSVCFSVSCCDLDANTHVLLWTIVKQTLGERWEWWSV